MIDPVVLTGILAIVVFMATLAVSVRKSTYLPTYESRETQLSNRITELEIHIKRQDETIEKQNNTIQALQTLLYEKQAKVEELTRRVLQLETNNVVKPPRPQRKPNLVVAVAESKQLQVDVAKLRGIKNLQLSVINNASKGDIEVLLEERRSTGKPVRYLHIAAHSGPSGVALTGGVADGIWFSEQGKDIEILVIAGCKGYRIAPLLTTIPFVVTMRDEITNDDASTFSFHFWFAIAQEKDPEDAFFYALEHSNPVVSEMAEFHSYE